MHTSIAAEVPGSDTLVIFIHGFLGSPDQFRRYIAALNEHGASCLALLLPGHGCSAREFARHGTAEWETAVLQAVEANKGKFTRIYLAGHSMGGLLALNACVKLGNAFSGLILLSTPWKVTFFSPRSIFQRLLLACYGRKNEIKTAYKSAQSVSGNYLALLLHMPRPGLEFFRVIRRAKQICSGVQVPVLLIHSKNDETVSFSSARLLKQSLAGAEAVPITLQSSWHTYYTAEEADIIQRAILSFVEPGPVLL